MGDTIAPRGCAIFWCTTWSSVGRRPIVPCKSLCCLHDTIVVTALCVPLHLSKLALNSWGSVHRILHGLVPNRTTRIPSASEGDLIVALRKVKVETRTFGLILIMMRMIWVSNNAGPSLKIAAGEAKY